MLAGEDQVLLGSPEIQVRVAEGMDITRPTQALTGGNTVRGVLAEKGKGDITDQGRGLRSLSSFVLGGRFHASR